ncbi:uncharacterized protein LOC143788188 [Ranitomeya variabilis]|uniref:uncharacterized protein LOC143788188 n=1 Tax=Ranitomeya variabilis TaxID=490064 RepID=UPI004055BEAC
MPAHMSAQEAELIEACKLAEGKTVNIYTDSRYAFGITHGYGPIWRARAFLTVNGHPFKRAEAVQQLMNALQLPTQAGIIKVKAHTKGTDGRTKGNALADQAAKKAASTPVASQVHHLDTPPSPLVSKDILARLQEQASKEEKNRWQKIGACSDTVTGLWGRGEKVCLPQVLYPMMAQVLHGNVHHSKTAMCDTLKRQWIAPGFSTCAESQVQSCMICATHNQSRTVKTPSKQTPRPFNQFQRLQIDYIQLPRVGTYEYVLVCIDLFSGWPETYPVAKATAKTTVKKLMAEIICRYGVPEVIESDQGSHFTGEIMSEETWQLTSKGAGSWNSQEWIDLAGMQVPAAITGAEGRMDNRVKWDIFEKRSTTTQMMALPVETGSSLTKSIAMCSKVADSMGRGSNQPDRSCLGVLFRAQDGQADMKFAISLRRDDH